MNAKTGFLTVLVVGLVIAALWVVQGTQTCGPVLRSVVDKHAALVHHDTVPSIAQNGDTAVYKMTCTTTGVGDHPGYFVWAGLLAVLLFFGVRRFASKPALNPATQPSAAQSARGYWTCTRCGRSNLPTDTVCVGCGYAKGGTAS